MLLGRKLRQKNVPNGVDKCTHWGYIYYSKINYLKKIEKSMEDKILEILKSGKLNYTAEER